MVVKKDATYLAKGIIKLLPDDTDIPIVDLQRKAGKGRTEGGKSRDGRQ
jgi:hypothetical protein